jgi:hypothetical protein
MPPESHSSRSTEARIRPKNAPDRKAGAVLAKFLRDEAAAVLPIAVAIALVDFLLSRLHIQERVPRSLWLILFVSLVSCLSFFLQKLQEAGVRFFVDPSPESQAPRSRGGRFLRGFVVLIVLPIAFEALKPPVIRLAREIFGFKSEFSAATRIANAVLWSPDLDTKKAGISVLGHINTADSAAELKRIVENERSCFTDSLCYETTVHAIDAADDKTMPQFLLSELVGHMNEAKNEGESGALGIDRRYFQSDFDALKDSLQTSGMDSNSKVQASAKLEELQAQVTSGLSSLKEGLPSASEKTILVELILDAYAGVKESKSDTDATYVARQIAEDRAYPSTIRAKAIALVGHAGKSDDEEWILKWVDGREEETRVAALLAYDSLDRKLRHPKKETDTNSQ